MYLSRFFCDRVVLVCKSSAEFRRKDYIVESFVFCQVDPALRASSRHEDVHSFLNFGERTGERAARVTSTKTVWRCARTRVWLSAAKFVTISLLFCVLCFVFWCLRRKRCASHNWKVKTMRSHHGLNRCPPNQKSAKYVGPAPTKTSFHF